jgi:hypothetical protein
MLNLDTHFLIYALMGRLTKKERELLTGDDWSNRTRSHRGEVTCRMILTAFVLVALAVLPAIAQEDSSRDTLDPRFREPDIPAPNTYRTAAGEPGPEYWQQRANYAIRVALDPTTHVVTGSETITYANNSPDTLAFVWIQLDQNLFAPGSKGSQVFPQEGRFGGSGFVGGYTIERVASGDIRLEHRIDDTMMRVDLAQPLPPGGSTTLSIDWRFTVPETGADRMGRDGDLHLLAQWYPRMAVYDDVTGWNTLPYLGQGEFYLEYGDFDVEITVPAAWIVAATGALQNADEVLTQSQRDRLTKARSGKDVVQVVTEAELANPASFRPRTDGTLTWRFRAENVRDFAWATGPDLVWDATSWNDVLTMAFYRPSAPASWREAAAMTQHSIEYYSKMLLPYPYPTASAVEGPVYGMEYPMIVFVGSVPDREGLFDVIDHEWGHMWFPMIVGTDERRYAWMDEGIDTFINQFSKKAYLPETQPVLQNVLEYSMAIEMIPEQSIATHADLFRSEMALGIAAYVKPAVFLNALRAVVGVEAFDRALAEFARVWAYKHPQPADFFRFMEDRLGEDLGVMWYGWVYTTETSDFAIAGVDQEQANGQWQVEVMVDLRGGLVMPAVVEARTAAGETARVTLPVQAFYGTDRATATLTLPDTASRITVNAAPDFGDVSPENNTWTR